MYAVYRINHHNSIDLLATARASGNSGWEFWRSMSFVLERISNFFRKGYLPIEFSLRIGCGDKLQSWEVNFQLSLVQQIKNGNEYCVKSRSLKRSMKLTQDINSGRFYIKRSTSGVNWPNVKPIQFHQAGDMHPSTHTTKHFSRCGFITSHSAFQPHSQDGKRSTKPPGIEMDTCCVVVA